MSALIRPPKQRIPAIAPKESWRLTLAAACGFCKSTSASTVESDVAGSFSRRNTGAMSSIDCMKPARTADGPAPVIATKHHISAMHKSELRRVLPRIYCKNPTRKETCIPDTAATCIKPERESARYKAVLSYSVLLSPSITERMKPDVSAGKIAFVSAATPRRARVGSAENEKPPSVSTISDFELAVRYIPFAL